VVSATNDPNAVGEGAKADAGVVGRYATEALGMTSAELIR
jgi:hypothetical protein